MPSRKKLTEMRKIFSRVPRECELIVLIQSVLNIIAGSKAKKIVLESPSSCINQLFPSLLFLDFLCLSILKILLTVAVANKGDKAVNIE